MNSHDNVFRDKTKIKLQTNLITRFTTPFHILTTALLGLLLPLSFLLLARVSSYSYLITTTLASSNPLSPPSSNNLLILWSLSYINPAVLYLVISILSGATLVHGLTGRSSSSSSSSSLLSTEPTVTIYRPKLYIAWILLYTLQVCVGLGIEGTISAGIDGYSSHNNDGVGSLFSRVIFLLGLHETMMHWTRTVVRPVVDDTVFGEERDVGRLQQVAAAACLSGLWWWRLRDEVESLVLVAEAKKELTLGLSLGDLLGWWLYYVTVTIGMVRIVKMLLWVGSVFILRAAEIEENGNWNDISGSEEKV